MAQISEVWRALWVSNWTWTRDRRLAYLLVSSPTDLLAAGGNVGGAFCSFLFMSFEYEWAMELMGWLTIGSSLLTFFIVVQGYQGLVFGTDDKDLIARNQQSPLVVPAKFQHSPHLVAFKRQLGKQREERKKERR